MEFRRTKETQPLESARQNVWSLREALRGVPPVESGLAELARSVENWKTRVEQALIFILALITLLLTVLTVVPILKEFGITKGEETKKDPASSQGKMLYGPAADAVNAPQASSKKAKSQ